jgi:pyrroloquinoline-quinone synthase
VLYDAGVKRADLNYLFDEALRDRRLLQHPFYRRWEAGQLELSELSEYAGQYRHFEAALPDVLDTVARGLEDADARALVRANLSDELGEPSPHLALFDDFTAEVGGSTSAEATPATGALVALYRDRCVSDPVGALAALAAYEVQAPQIASSKADGLRDHYGISPRGARFWEVHGVMDERHASWSLDALESVAPDEDAVRTAARQAADAWWAFLDERELSSTRRIGQPA